MYLITIDGVEIDLEEIVVPPPDGQIIIWGNGTVVMSHYTYNNLSKRNITEHKAQMSENIEIFRCPLYDNCVGVCKAPFLLDRRTNEKICAIRFEKDKIKNWPDAIEAIGRY